MSDEPGVMLTTVVGRVEALPEHQSVVRNTKVRYRLVVEEDEPLLWFGRDGEWTEHPKVKQFDETGRSVQPIPYDILAEYDGRVPSGEEIGSTLRWMVIYDKHPDDGDTPPYEVLGSGHEIEIKWKYPGQHVILCQVGWDAPKPTAGPRELAITHILFTQRVADLKTVQRTRMKRQTAKDLPNPFEEMDALNKYLDAVRSAERASGCPDGKREKYEREMRQRERYLEALAEIVDPLERHRTIPVAASYAARDTSEQVDLRICIQETGRIRMDGASSWEVWLCDWTNPLDNRLRGRYWASAETRDDALRKVVAEWRENNEYYHPGNVVVEFPPGISIDRHNRTPVRHSFDTPSPGFWGKLKEFLDAIALALGVATALVALILPVPGSRVVSGLIWASIFTSTAASAIQIGRRKNNGFGDWKEDAFDLLTIAGNLFTAGQMRWARGAVLVSRSFQGQYKRFCLMGEVATDALQGLLIAEEKFDEFEAILSDSSLSPSERVDKLLEVGRSMLVTGALHVVSVRGERRSHKRGERPQTMIDPPTRKRLKDPREVIDLDATPAQKGEVGAGELRTKKQDEPQRARPKKKKKVRRVRKKRRKHSFKPAPAPEKRGVRGQDDFDFAQQAQESDKIILVRDSNPKALRHVENDAAGPKPESLKAKSLRAEPPPTLRNPENAGLAAAHPDDPRVHEMLAEMKSPKTGKPPMSYDEFVAELGRSGYKVRDADGDYVVYSDAHPGGYYSDYDLHGVYDLKGRDAYTEAYRAELNSRFGKELIQHGPHDKWPKRNKKEAGPNRGPQPPVTAYVPRKKSSGETVVERYHLDTIDEMREFYEAWDIPWKRIYPPY